MQFTGSSSELDLPPIYHCLANCDNKSNHLILLRKAISDCTCNRGAATAQLPVISKETKEMVLSGNFGVPAHEHDDLLRGLQPFAVGLFLGNKLGKTIHARAENYILMLARQANPTIKEQATFSTNEICIPQDPLTAGLKLSTTSIQVNVFMGVNHLFASAFRTFCLDSWPKIQMTIHLASQFNPSITATIIPGIMRWIQLEMVTYMDHIMSGSTTIDILNFGDLITRARLSPTLAVATPPRVQPSRSLVVSIICACKVLLAMIPFVLIFCPTHVHFRVQ